jgi:hypothetical protein
VSVGSILEKKKASEQAPDEPMVPLEEVSVHL